MIKLYTYLIVDSNAAETVKKEKKWWLDVTESCCKCSRRCKLLHLRLQWQSYRRRPPYNTQINYTPSRWYRMFTDEEWTQHQTVQIRNYPLIHRSMPPT